MAVKIFGHTVSTPAAAAIAGGSGLAIWFAYKQHKASASSSASSTSIDPVTGLPYSQDNTVDPLTGLTYLAEATEYGSVSAAEQAVAGEAGDDLSSGAGTTGTGSSGTTTTETGGYASNAAWAQAVEAGLTDLGYSSTDVADALGLYLDSQPLAALPDGVSAVSIVQAALAEYGPPPVGTYTIIMPPATGPTGSGAGGGGVTGTPTGPVTGTPSGPTSPTPTGAVTVAPTGFRVVSVTNGDDVNLAWNPVAASTGVTGYTIAYGPTSGSQKYKQGVGGGNTSAATVAGVGAGSAGSHYFEIWAEPASPGGPHAGPIEATTTKT